MIKETVLSGKVLIKTILNHSNIGHLAAVLVVGSKEYQLRQNGAPPGLDDILKSLDGKKIKGEGKLYNGMFILSDYEEIE